MFRKRAVQFQPNGKSLERFALTSDRLLKVHLSVMRISIRNLNTPQPPPWHGPGFKIPAVSGQNSVRMPYSIAGFVCQMPAPLLKNNRRRLLSSLIKLGSKHACLVTLYVMMPFTNAQLEIIKEDLKLNEIIKSDNVSKQVYAPLTLKHGKGSLTRVYTLFQNGGL